MSYDCSNTELKKFNTYDSAGVLFSHKLNIPVGIITGENSQIVQRRANKLNVDYCFLGVKDKVQVAKQLCKQLGISIKDVAYIGDDINDIQLLKLVGMSGVPSSAPIYIKEIANISLTKKGGEGAFREFVEIIFGNDILKQILDDIQLLNQ